MNVLDEPTYSTTEMILQDCDGGEAGNVHSLWILQMRDADEALQGFHASTRLMNGTHGTSGTHCVPFIPSVNLATSPPSCLSDETVKSYGRYAVELDKLLTMHPIKPGAFPRTLLTYSLVLDSSIISAGGPRIPNCRTVSVASFWL